MTQGWRYTWNYCTPTSSVSVHGPVAVDASSKMQEEQRQEEWSASIYEAMLLNTRTGRQESRGWGLPKYYWM